MYYFINYHRLFINLLSIIDRVIEGLLSVLEPNEISVRETIIYFRLCRALEVVIPIEDIYNNFYLDLEEKLSNN